MRRLCVKIFAGWLLCVGTVSIAVAEVKLPSVFSSHAVLQREMPVPVWGWAAKGEKVTVTLGSQSATATADDSGKWSVRLDALEAGGPLSLVVKGTNTIKVDDILVGEVWLCSGQSNMGMTVGGVLNAKEEIAGANYPKIRQFHVANKTAETPQSECQGTWSVCSPETVGGYSATAYFFGWQLHKDLSIPIGLINSSWGGTPIEAWTCEQLQIKTPELKPGVDGWNQKIADWNKEKAEEKYAKDLTNWKKHEAKAKAEHKPAPRRPNAPADPRFAPHRPGSLYNGMIVPLVPYALRGAIWYQGESNAGRGELYGLQLQTMIGNWRELWNQGDFPVLFVQLPNFQKPQTEPVENSGWALVREGMFKTLQKTPKTGMAITIDVGEDANIHPKNKQEVGRRLGLFALRDVYSKKIVGCGPLYKSMTRDGDKIVVTFECQDSGLVAKGEKVEGFAIAGADKKFVWADAKIDGDRVVVSSPTVKNPVAVRYAWATNPKCNVYNQAGIPASPFRTDDGPTK